MTAEETRCCDCTLEVTETEEGFRVELKGDKEQLKAGVEAIKALVTCWAEAHAAGCCCHSHGFGFPPAFAHAYWHHAGHHARHHGRHHPMRGHHHGGPMGRCCG